MTDKKDRTALKEKIANDFLLQFAYAIAGSIMLLFIYNASMFKYGADIGAAMPKVIWGLFGICLVLGAVFFVLWKKEGKNVFKIAAIYCLVTAFGLFWCVGVQHIAYYLKRFIPPLGFFANTKRLMEMLFILLGLSVAAELAVYFYRMNGVSGKRIKNAKRRNNKVR